MNFKIKGNRGVYKLLYSKQAKKMKMDPIVIKLVITSVNVYILY